MSKFQALPEATQNVEDQRSVAAAILHLHAWSRDLAAYGDTTARQVFEDTGIVILQATRLAR